MSEKKFFCDGCIVDAVCTDGCKDFAEYCKKELSELTCTPEIFIKKHLRYTRTYVTCESFLKNSFMALQVTTSRKAYQEKLERKECIERILEEAEKLNW